MIHNGVVVGKPLVSYNDTKSNIIALSGLIEGMTAYATDSDELGTFNGSSWYWIPVTSGSYVPIVHDINGAYHNGFPLSSANGGTGVANSFTLAISGNSTINGSLVGNISGGGLVDFVLATDSLTISGDVGFGPSSLFGNDLFLQDINNGTIYRQEIGKTFIVNNTLTISGVDGSTLTIPATGTAALLGVANVFTAVQKINVNNALALLVEQDGVKDNTFIVDTANARVGVNGVPGYAFDVHISAPTFPNTTVAQFINDNTSDGNMNVVFSGYSSNTNLAFGTQRAGAYFVLFNKNNTNGNYTGFTFWNATGGQSASILGINVTQGGAGVAEGALSFNTRNTALNLHESMRIDKDGNVGINIAVPTSRLHVVGSADAVQTLIVGHTTQTATVASIARADTAGTGVRPVLSLDFSGSGADNNGGSIPLLGRNSTTAGAAIARIAWSLPTAAVGSYKGRFVLYASDAGGEREIMRGEASGTAPMLSFYGVSAVVQQANNTAIDTLLSNLGLRATGGESFFDTRLMLPMGEISYFDLTGTTVAIAAQSDGSTNMVKAAPATTLNNDKDFDNGGANDGRLRYTGATTRTFHVACTISIAPDAANDTFVCGISKSGTVVAASKVLLQATTMAGIRSTALHVMVSLATNDYLELYIGNITDADDCTVHSLNIFAMGM